jgi:carbamoyl-phosphate synthase large subunit
VQFREDKNGNWKVQEINMRTNGNTFPRFVMGQDDIGLIFQGVLPEINFPVYKAPLYTQNIIIGKTLTSYSMNPENIQNLKDRKFWEK